MKYTLALKDLPFEPLRNQIIYVENGYDEVVNKFILDNYDKICDYCSQRNYEFCYLPKLTAQPIDEEVLFYNAPYAKPQEAPKPVGSDFLLEFLAQPKNRELIPPSLLYLGNRGRIKSDDGVVTFKAMSVTDQAVYPYVEDIFFWRLQDIFLEKEEDESSHERIMFSKEASKDDTPRFSKEKSDDDGLHFYMPVDDEPKFSREPKKKGKLLKEVSDNKVFYFNEPDETRKYNQTADLRFDEESKQIADEIKERKERLEKKGISWLAVMEYVMGDKPLSRLRITKDYHIFLPDYKNIEINITPLPKAVFLLFLRHPEGIPFRYLPDYLEELKDIYMAAKGSEVLSEAELRSIERVTDKFDNSINEKCSRIREAFVGRFDEHLAENYFVTGKRGEPKKIKLPRELVIWE